MIQLEKSEAVLSGPEGEVLVRKTPSVCGGDACLGNSRIMVWLIIGLKNDGLSDVEILEEYPTLGQSDLAAAGEYYRRHPDEINAAIKANEKDLD